MGAEVGVDEVGAPGGRVAGHEEEGEEVVAGVGAGCDGGWVDVFVSFAEECEDVEGGGLVEDGEAAGEGYVDD